MKRCPDEAPPLPECSRLNTVRRGIAGPAAEATGTNFRVPDVFGSNLKRRLPFPLSLGQADAMSISPGVSGWPFGPGDVRLKGNVTVEGGSVTPSQRTAVANRIVGLTNVYSNVFLSRPVRL
jgi:hypothetical protein